MAKSSRLLDQFAQPLACTLSASALASTTAYSQIATAYSAKDRVGLVLHAIEYMPRAINGVFDTAGDTVRFGLAVSSAQPTGGFLNTTPGVLDYNVLERSDIGAAAVAFYNNIVRIFKDFSNLPGGGYLLHPSFLFAWSYTVAALGTTFPIDIRLWYTIKAISDADYTDLWQNMILLTTV